MLKTLIGLFFCLAFQSYGQNDCTIHLSLPHGYRLPQINSTDQNVFVSIHNETDSTVFFYRDWCSFGFYNIYFEIKTKDSIYQLVKTPKVWYRNFHDYYTVHPNEIVTFNYHLIDSLKALELEEQQLFIDSWTGFPKTADTVQIRAIYELHNPNDSIPGENITRLNVRKEEYLDYLEGDIESAPQSIKKSVQKSVRKREVIFNKKLVSDWYTVLLMK